ncbi:hypothetical protein EON62_01265 [archaeon]|nr:MAG: hypothetical protein EON62_01265 [archaeon]
MQACVLLKRAIELREKYVFHKPTHYWGPYAPTEFPFSPRLSGMSMPAAGGTPSRTGSAPAELETEGDAGSFNFDLTGSSGDLVTATTTGLVAAPQAAPLVAQGLLHGSQLVTLETGKDYGNLFYRRRLEPPFTAFNVPTAPADDLSFRFVNGVVRVYRAPADEGMCATQTLHTR